MEASWTSTANFWDCWGPQLVLYSCGGHSKEKGLVNHWSRLTRSVCLSVPDSLQPALLSDPPARPRGLWQSLRCGLWAPGILCQDCWGEAPAKVPHLHITSPKTQHPVLLATQQYFLMMIVTSSYWLYEPAVSCCRNSVLLMIRKVQNAPEEPGPQPQVETSRSYLMSDRSLHLEVSLDKEVAQWEHTLTQWLPTGGVSCLIHAGYVLPWLSGEQDGLLPPPRLLLDTLRYLHCTLLLVCTRLCQIASLLGLRETCDEVSGLKIAASKQADCELGHSLSFFPQGIFPGHWRPLLVHRPCWSFHSLIVQVLWDVFRMFY